MYLHTFHAHTETLDVGRRRDGKHSRETTRRSVSRSRVTFVKGRLEDDHARAHVVVGPAERATALAAEAAMSLAERPSQSVSLVPDGRVAAGGAAAVGGPPAHLGTAEAAVAVAPWQSPLPRAGLPRPVPHQNTSPHDTAGGGGSGPDTRAAAGGRGRCHVRPGTGTCPSDLYAPGTPSL